MKAARFDERRALTVWQPLASLLFLPEGKGFYKQFETRSWRTDYRGPLAIHASAKDVREVIRAVQRPATLRALGEGVLRILYPDGPPPGTDWQTVIELLRSSRDGILPRKALIGTVELADCLEITPELRAEQPARELAVGNWRPGAYAWVFKNRRLFDAPITINGQQGLWRY